MQPIIILEKRLCALVKFNLKHSIVTRKHSSRMRTARLSDSGGRGVSLQRPPPDIDPTGQRPSLDREPPDGDPPRRNMGPGSESVPTRNMVPGSQTGSDNIQRTPPPSPCEQND